ncbi:hypothetical protein M0208_13120 [Sphingomonas sp. SUN019]|uniref:hypothetical protein n=1 Tax=Sphingomonas sp. SUN019 TaxID=2937788 RepID=UPI00216437F3|nr:hypothetical protein [Sphingomonas sp. SUN019]UVO51397.1 hypothetical protein M0208_13120 [Sphingomonas sp. SUN019]
MTRNPYQWRWPIVLAVLTTLGLIAALIGEGGVWWPASWIALGVPLVLAGWHMWRPR